MISPFLETTLRKYSGASTPSLPSVRITLFEEMKKSIPSFMAASMSI